MSQTNYFFLYITSFIQLFVLLYKEIKQDIINYKMNKWSVDSYANNTFLYNIPNSRKNEKLEEVKNEKINCRDIVDIIYLKLLSYFKNLLYD